MPKSNDSDQSASQNLPNLRKGLTYTFSDYDFEGRPQWLIHDSGRNKFFIIGWPEYEMLMRWDLGSPQAVIDAVNSETTLNVDMKDLDKFVQFLSHNYLLEQTGKKILESAKNQNLMEDEHLFHWAIKRYLFFRVPLWHPDKFLNKTAVFGKLLLNRYLGYLMIFLGLLAIYEVSMRWDTFVSTFPSVISWQGFFYYFIAFTFVKILHEAGHAYRCKEYGIPVPNCGIAFLVFWPVLYTDTTLSWTLDSRKRLSIAVAGIQVETYVTILAALTWCYTDNLTLQTICYVTIAINYMASLLINVSPFMRFDGYYILADFMKMPNLQYRAFSLTRWQIRRWLFDWPEPPPEVYSSKIHYFLVIYSIATWLYRLFLYIGIALLVYYMFFKIAGIILFFIEIYYFILEPIVKELKLWFGSKDKFQLNVNTIITLTALVVLVGIFFIPFKSSIELPATMHYEHQFLYAPEEGMIVKRLPPAGTKVRADETIAELGSPILTYALKKTRLEYEKLLSERRRAAVDDFYAKDVGAIMSALEKKRTEYERLLELHKKLILSVPFNGIVVDSASGLGVGSYVKKNEWLGDVIDPNKIEVEAYVKQIDLDLLKKGGNGYFYPADLGLKKVPVKLSLIEPLNPSQLVCHFSQDITAKTSDRLIVETPCYHSSDFGGEIATYRTDQGEYVPVKSVYRVIFEVDKDIDLKYISRGHVRVETSARSYAARFFYHLNRILIQEKEF